MEEIKANNSRIVKNTVYLTIRMFIVLIVSLYTVRVVLRELGTVDYGILNVVGGLVAMFGFLNASMNNAIQRFYNYEMGKNGYQGGKRVYNSALVIQFLLAIIIFILLESIGLWFLYNKLVIPDDRFQIAFWLFQFSTLGSILVIMQIPFSASIIAHEKMDYFAIVSIIDVILKLAIALSIPYSPIDKLFFYGLMILIIRVLIFLLYYVYAKVRFDELKFYPHYDKLFIKEMLSFSGWNLFGNFSRIGKEQGFNMLLNMFFGPTINAARGLAYQISASAQSFVNTITTSARPQLTHAYAQDHVDRSIYIMYIISKISYLSVLMLSIPIFYEIYFILSIWLGDTIPNHTHAFVRLVLLANMIRIFSPPTSFLVHATGKMKKYQFFTSVVTISFIPVAYIFLKLGASAEFVFGIAALFTLLSLVTGIYILSTLIDFSIKKYLRNVTLPMMLITIITALISLIPLFILQEGWVRLIIVSMCSFLSTTIAGYVIGLNKKEKTAVSTIIKKKLPLS